MAWLAVLAAAAWVRLDQLGGPSLWLDEILTAERTRLAQTAPLREWFTGFSFDREIGPVFYASEALAGAATGTEWNIRLPAALAGILTVGFVMLAGRRLVDDPTGLLAGAFLAFSPAHVAYSREGRPYALLMLGTAVLVWLWVQAAGRQRRIPAAVWIGTGVLLAAVGAVAGGILVAAAGVSAAMLRHPTADLRRSARGLGAGALAGLGAVTVLYLSTGRFQPGLSSEPMAGVTRPGSWTSIDRLVASHTTAGLDALAQTDLLSWIFLAIGLLGAFVLLRSTAGRGVAIFALATPLVTLAALAATGHWYSIRYTLVALPAFALCFAAGAQTLLGRWLEDRPSVRATSMATLAILVVAVGWSPAWAGPWMRTDWRRITAVVVEHTSADTPILTTNRWTHRCLGHYLDRCASERRLVPGAGSGAELAVVAQGLAPCLVVSGGFHRDASAAQWASGLPRLHTAPDGEALVALLPDAAALVTTLDAAARARWAARVRGGLPLEFDGRSRVLLGAGWGPTEADPDGRTYRWTVGDEAGLLFALSSSTTAIRLTARAFEGIAQPTVPVDVTYDGALLRRIPLGTEWRQVTIPIPPRRHPDIGTLRFELAVPRSAIPAAAGTERRPLGIAVDRLEVSPP